MLPRTKLSVLLFITKRILTDAIRNLRKGGPTTPTTAKSQRNEPTMVEFQNCDWEWQGNLRKKLEDGIYFKGIQSMPCQKYAT